MCSKWRTSQLFVSSRYDDTYLTLCHYDTLANILHVLCKKKYTNISIVGSCPECGERNVTVNTSDGGWVTHTPNDIQFEGATEPTTEDTTVVAAVSISVAVIVGVLVILVIIFAVWLLWGMYCRRHSGSMYI